MPNSDSPRKLSWLTHVGLVGQFVLCGYLLAMVLGSELGFVSGPKAHEAPAWWYPLILYGGLVLGVLAPFGIRKNRAWGYFFEAPIVAFVLYALWRSDIHSGTIWRMPELETPFRIVLTLGFIASVGEVTSRGFAVLRRSSADGDESKPPAPLPLNRRTLFDANRFRRSSNGGRRG